MLPQGHRARALTATSSARLQRGHPFAAGPFAAAASEPDKPFAAGAEPFAGAAAAQNPSPPSPPPPKHAPKRTLRRRRRHRRRHRRCSRHRRRSRRRSEALALLSVAALAAAAIAFALAAAEIAVAIADDAAAHSLTSSLCPCSLVISPVLGLGGVNHVTELPPLTAWSAPQVIHPRLLKYLVATCMLDCVCAATLPSSAPKFEADVPDPSDKTTVLARHAFTTLGPLHIALTLALWPQPPISVPGLWALRA